MRVRRALLSVSDKRGIVDFARGLANLGVEIVSTGGTGEELRAAGLEVRPIDSLTGLPEIMDGRVKTLHPKLHAGLLALRDDPTHVQAAAEIGVEFIDLVCVNLYPFERTAARRDVDETAVLDQIDVGGPAMIRAAAKNFRFTAVVVRPEAYDAVLEELNISEALLSLPTRESLAAEAFASTARYDTAIARWFALRGDDFPSLHVRAYEKIADLPYGENPHQRAAYYARVDARTHALAQVQQHHGKALSYNNILDLDAARGLIRDLSGLACAIVKHNNPCGVAVADAPVEAWRRALQSDPVSAFGGVVVMSHPVDRAAAVAISEHFSEVLLAPSYEDDALALLAERRPNLRILEDHERRAPPLRDKHVRPVTGGLLVQDSDLVPDEPDTMEVVTSHTPTRAQWRDLGFAWRVCRHVRSNAIVLARDGATLGIGAGQMSRVDSVRIAVDKAQGSAEGAVMASDAFFPFADGPALAVQAGVRAIIQPGGSVRDDEVVAAAEEAGVAMIITRRRHFRH